VLFGTLGVTAPASAQAASVNNAAPAGPDARYSDLLVRVVRVSTSVRAGLSLQLLSDGLPDTEFANPELVAPVLFDTVGAGIETDGADTVTKGLAKKGNIRSGDLLRISGFVGEQSVRRRRCQTGCWDWSGKVVLVITGASKVGRCALSKTFKSVPPHWWDSPSSWRLGLCFDRTASGNNTSMFLLPENTGGSTRESVKSLTVQLSPKDAPAVGPLELAPGEMLSISLSISPRTRLSVRPYVVVDWADDGRDAATFKLPSLRF
jgi:hypothetical protein